MTYVVPADTDTAGENVTDCQPEADSFVNVAVASETPVDDHNEPVCVPVFAADL